MFRVGPPMARHLALRKAWQQLGLLLSQVAARTRWCYGSHLIRSLKVRKPPRIPIKTARLRLTSRRTSVPNDLTTWQWAFESPKYAPTSYAAANDQGSYINATTGESLDFLAVREKATQLSAALVEQHGMAPTDTVSLFSSNSIWYPVAMWATVRAGGRVNGASPAYNADEMAHALRTAGTRFLFTLPGSLDVALQAAAMVGLAKERIFLLEGQREGILSIQDLIAAGRSCRILPAWSIPQGQTNMDVCGYLNFSSGTTGLPKAVMLSHGNLIAQCHQLRQLQLVPEGRRYTILAVMPLFHITGLVRFCHYPVLLNGDSVMLPAFNMEAMLQTVIKYEIEELILVPPIIVRIVRDSIVQQYLPDLQRIVKTWSSGSAPVSPEIIELLRLRFPDTGFRQGYGATESTAALSCHPPSHYDYKYAATAGILVANTVAKVISLEDPTKELAAGETGEICAKGPQIAMGYLNNPAATREAFDTDGFLHTGDVGTIDEEGLIRISDRIKEMIKVKGQQVAPAELEDLLLGEEVVEDCAVLGIPDGYAGERPKAYVVLKTGVQPDVGIGRMLLDKIKQRKVRYKWLTELEFTDTVPKSPTGKLLRRVLKVNDRNVKRRRGLVVREQSERAKL
nr:putative 4-coumarate--coa ligase 1 [Quercus suber]